VLLLCVGLLFFVMIRVQARYCLLIYMWLFRSGWGVCVVSGCESGQEVVLVAGWEVGLGVALREWVGSGLGLGLWGWAGSGLGLWL